MDKSGKEKIGLCNLLKTQFNIWELEFRFENNSAPHFIIRKDGHEIITITVFSTMEIWINTHFAKMVEIFKQREEITKQKVASGIKFEDTFDVVEKEFNELYGPILQELHSKGIALCPTDPNFLDNLKLHIDTALALY